MSDRQVDGCCQELQRLTTSVLVVEDDQDTLENVRDILEQDGYSVEGAGSLHEALDHPNWSEYTIIILDRRLPDGNADELLPRLKQLAPGTSFIVATGHNDLDGTITALQDGAADYILKPINADLLRASMLRLARMHAAERRARQNERLAAIGQMVTAIAHESRNSLQRIQSAVEMLQMDLGDPHMEELARIERATDNIRELLEEVRSYAAPINLDRENCNISKVWQSAWSQVAGSRPEGNLSLKEHTIGCHLTCSIDRFRFEQVFRNLFENSLAACASAPQVAVKCAETHNLGQKSLRISVCDNGTGIAECHRDKAFEPFYTTKQKGTGLGMAIVKRIVEAHGGSVTIGPNREPGAELIITLPRTL